MSSLTPSPKQPRRGSHRARYRDASYGEKKAQSRRSGRFGRYTVKVRWGRELRWWLCALVAISLLGYGINHFLFKNAHVEGPSMQPTLEAGQVVFVWKANYWFSPPQRWDIVVCDYPGQTDHFIKRVVGLPGETISVENGLLCVNGMQIEDPYFIGLMDYDLRPTFVPQDCVFVMGDNRNNSLDSRNPNVGPIKLEMIVGRAVARLWPLSQMSGL